MSEYIINAIDSSDVANSFYPDVGFEYTDPLNGVGEASLIFSSLSVLSRNNITLGTKIHISRDSTTEHYGLVDHIDNLDGGGYVVHSSNYDIWLSKENGDYANSPYKSTASATIASELIAESAYLTEGTIAAGVDIDFRIEKSDSLLNGIGNLVRKTGQDYQLDYTSLSAIEIDIVDHRGSTTSVATLNNPEISNMRVARTYPSGNKIVVYGKGDGDNQIKSETPSHGYDAASVAAYGIITRPVIDRTIISVDEANTLADIEVATSKDETKTYFFNVNDIGTTAETGDVITLNSEEHDLSDEEVRIVKITRGMRSDEEILNYQVTNASNSKVLKLRDRNIADLRKEQRDNSTYMQGSGNTNTWGLGINAKTGAAAKIKFYLPAEYIQDEAGNSNISLFTVSYDIDPFLKQYGTASFDGADPQVQNTSADEDASVSGDSGSTAPGVGGDSGDEDASVSGDSGTDAPAVSGTSATANAVSWGAGYGGNSGGVSSGTLDDSSWETIINTSTLYTHTDLIMIFLTFKNDNTINNRTIRVYATQDGNYYPSSAGTYTHIPSGNSATVVILVPKDVYGDDIYVRAQTESGDMDYEVTWNYTLIGTHDHEDGSYAAASHSHDDGSYAAASHSHDDGTYAAASHDHSDGSYLAADHDHADGTYDINAADINDISIADGLSEAGSVSSTSVNLYLDFYNTGTSTWDVKHSILATGVTIDEDVDISNSGTYPDAAGWWRVRVEPITATADFAQGIVKIKNNVDN